MNEMSSVEDNQNKPKIWELRSGDKVLGILTENDWYQPPFRGYDFKPKSPYKKYAGLFAALMKANNRAWAKVGTTNEDLVPEMPEEMEKQEQHLSDLKGQVGALILKMHPIDQEAPDARIVLIFIDKNKARLIPDFERYNPFDYLEWDAD
jgi:hypothetical protein